jgi:hypothetical protein
VIPLTEEEKAESFRIARNFQDNPKKVYRLLCELVGRDRIQLVIDYLKEVAE